MYFPSLLSQGSKIAIVAPAGKLANGALKEAIKSFDSWGIEVILGKHVYDQNDYFAGTDNDRLADLQWAMDDPTIEAILFARGGYGTTRILDEINFLKFKAQPKWLIGFSDITALHLKLQTLEIASIHGPMGISFGQKGSSNSIESLKTLLFKGTSDLNSSQPALRSGSIEAEVTGGNLALLADSFGTSSEIDPSNKILFIEDVGENTYRIDRMLRQLLRAGKLDNLAGLVVGHFSLIDDGDTPFGQSWREVIEEVTNRFNYPLAFGFNIGHEPENIPIVVGGTYQFNAGEASSSLRLLSKS
jgi:muramoyltetrapeptide carboxypeptidase